MDPDLQLDPHPDLDPEPDSDPQLDPHPDLDPESDSDPQLDPQPDLDPDRQPDPQPCLESAGTPITHPCTCQSATNTSLSFDSPHTHTQLGAGANDQCKRPMQTTNANKTQQPKRAALEGACECGGDHPREIRQANKQPYWQFGVA